MQKGFKDRVSYLKPMESQVFVGVIKTDSIKKGAKQWQQ